MVDASSPEAFHDTNETILSPDDAPLSVNATANSGPIMFQEWTAAGTTAAVLDASAPLPSQQ
jgi:hypothetical protein